MSVKETLPPLTAMLGLWLIFDEGIRVVRQRTRHGAAGAVELGTESRAGAAELAAGNRIHQFIQLPQVRHGLALILVSTAWFLATTFFDCGTAGAPTFWHRRPHLLCQSLRLKKTLNLLSMLPDPARWRYLLGLLASVGFLPLLAPDLLLLGLPVFVANFFSSFPGQYSGEQHYSAPLAAALLIAAVYGVRRLAALTSLRKTNGQSLRLSVLLTVLAWLGGWSLGYHTLHGWTPLSSRAETYRPGPASIRLPDFAARIPSDAVVSASAAVHPHLAHRQVIYTFPTVQDAAYLLVDITDIPGVHPNDARAKIFGHAQHRLADCPGRARAGCWLDTPPRPPPHPRCPPHFSISPAPPVSPDIPTALTFGDGRLRLLGLFRP